MAHQSPAISFNHMDERDSAPGLLTFADRMMLVSLVFFCALAPYIRYEGGLLFVAFLAVSTVYVFVERGFVLIWPLASLTVLGCLYVALSYSDVLPDAWTRFYYQWAIPQQAAFVVALYPMTLAGRQLFLKLIPRHSLVPLGASLLIAYVGGATIFWSQSGSSQSIMSYLVSNLNNGITLALGGILLIADQKGGWKRTGLVLATSSFILLGDPTTQIAIVSILLIALLPSATRYYVLIGFIVSLVAATLYSFVDLYAIWKVDPNTAIRAVFWRDVIDALVSSNGLGLGFGKEVIRNYYGFVGHVHYDKPYDQLEAFLYTGVHNSFFGVAMRLGIIGAALLVVYFFLDLFPRGARGHRYGYSTSMAFILILITCYVNVGIESPTIMVAIAILSGFIIACRDLQYVAATIPDGSIAKSPDTSY